MGLDKIAKAVVGGLVAGATAWGTAVSDGVVTATEWSGVVVAFLVTLGVVWGVPNTADPNAPLRPISK